MYKENGEPPNDSLTFYPKSQSVALQSLFILVFILSLGFGRTDVQSLRKESRD